jgi:nanoRNase/pAp phosphatase (c-di-AMP/oligoRNAs hydrolase)
MAPPQPLSSGTRRRSLVSMAKPLLVENGAVRHGRRILEFLREHRQTLAPMLIITHDFPDPDAMAAAYGLQHIAEAAFGMETRIAYRGEIGRVENKAMVRLLHIPVYRFRSAWLDQYRGLALVDTQPTFSNNPFPNKLRADLILDQHTGKGRPEAGLAIIDPDCGATCVLVAQALLQSGLEIPSRLATGLAYGILTDTLDLYRARRRDVVETYLQVLHHADMRLLARIQKPVRPRRFFSILARGISEARLHRQALITHLGVVDTPDRVAQVAEFLLTYRRARWVLATGRHKGRLRASLRAAQRDAEAGPVLRDAFLHPEDAGGHGPTAGGSCRIGLRAAEEVWQTKERELAERVIKRLRISATTEPRRPFNH